MLSHAKLVQARFFYDFVCRYLEDQTFQLVNTDTDSVSVVRTPAWVAIGVFQLYLALSRPTIHDCVKPERRAEFEANWRRWLADPTDPHAKLTPQIYKVEKSSKAMVALAPKLYCCFDEITPAVRTLVADILDGTDNFRGELDDDMQKMKLSTRGVSKRHNSYGPLHFLQALKTSQSVEGTNKMFLFRRNKLYLTSMTKRGIDSLFVKKYLLPCRIRTRHFRGKIKNAKCTR